MPEGTRREPGWASGLHQDFWAGGRVGAMSARASMSENASLTPQPGTLYVVATPIGNLADLTERARAILGAVDLVACEDTRTTGGLLTRLGLHRELTAYHDHNEMEAANRLADLVTAGKSVALVSNAGTPT